MRKTAGENVANFVCLTKQQRENVSAWNFKISRENFGPFSCMTAIVKLSESAHTEHV